MLHKVLFLLLEGKFSFCPDLYVYGEFTVDTIISSRCSHDSRYRRSSTSCSIGGDNFHTAGGAGGNQPANHGNSGNMNVDHHNYRSAHKNKNLQKQNSNANVEIANDELLDNNSGLKLGTKGILRWKKAVRHFHTPKKKKELKRRFSEQVFLQRRNSLLLNQSGTGGNLLLHSNTASPTSRNNNGCGSSSANRGIVLNHNDHNASNYLHSVDEQISPCGRAINDVAYNNSVRNPHRKNKPTLQRRSSMYVGPPPEALVRKTERNSKTNWGMNGVVVPAIVPNSLKRSSSSARDTVQNQHGASIAGGSFDVVPQESSTSDRSKEEEGFGSSGTSSSYSSSCELEDAPAPVREELLLPPSRNSSTRNRDRLSFSRTNCSTKKSTRKKENRHQLDNRLISYDSRRSSSARSSSAASRISVVSSSRASYCDVNNSRSSRIFDEIEDEDSGAGKNCSNGFVSAGAGQGQRPNTGAPQRRSRTNQPFLLPPSSARSSRMSLSRCSSRSNSASVTRENGHKIDVEPAVVASSCTGSRKQDNTSSASSRREVEVAAYTGRIGGDELVQSGRRVRTDERRNAFEEASSPSPDASPEIDVDIDDDEDNGQSDDIYPRPVKRQSTVDLFARQSTIDFPFENVEFLDDIVEEHRDERPEERQPFSPEHAGVDTRRQDVNTSNLCLSSTAKKGERHLHHFAEDEQQQIQYDEGEVADDSSPGQLLLLSTDHRSSPEFRDLRFIHEEADEMHLQRASGLNNILPGSAEDSSHEESCSHTIAESEPNCDYKNVIKCKSVWVWKNASLSCRFSMTHAVWHALPSMTGSVRSLPCLSCMRDCL